MKDQRTPTDPWIDELDSLQEEERAAFQEILQALPRPEVDSLPSDTKQNLHRTLHRALQARKPRARLWPWLAGVPLAAVVLAFLLLRSPYSESPSPEAEVRVAQASAPQPEAPLPLAEEPPRETDGAAEEREAAVAQAVEAMESSSEVALERVHQDQRVRPAADDPPGEVAQALAPSPSRVRAPEPAPRSTQRRSTSMDEPSTAAEAAEASAVAPRAEELSVGQDAIARLNDEPPSARRAAPSAPTPQPPPSMEQRAGLGATPRGAPAPAPSVGSGRPQATGAGRPSRGSAGAPPAMPPPEAPSSARSARPSAPLPEQAPARLADERAPEPVVADADLAAEQGEGAEGPVAAEAQRWMSRMQRTDVPRDADAREGLDLVSTALRAGRTSEARRIVEVLQRVLPEHPATQEARERLRRHEP